LPFLLRNELQIAMTSQWKIYVVALLLSLVATVPLIVADDPLEFIARLASLVPRPRTHLVTYHGVLAPASSWRDDVVPADNPGPIPPSHSLSGSTPVQNASNPSPSTPPAPHRIPWAELLRRVFAVDALRCTHCSGRRRVIAVIQDPVPVRAILRHLGLDPEPIPIAPARSPPELAFPA
jgi:hypothetical protein